MTERVFLQIADETGNAVIVDETMLGVEIQINRANSNLWLAVNNLHDAESDDEARLIQKFDFCLCLKNFLTNYLEEMKNNGNQSRD